MWLGIWHGDAFSVLLGFSCFVARFPNQFVGYSSCDSWGREAEKCVKPFDRFRVQPLKHSQKTNTMNTKLKSILTCLGLAILTVFTFTGCQSTGSGGGSNTHEMGGPRTPRMDNSIMPNRGN